jgi:hypothetical protein
MTDFEREDMELAAVMGGRFTDMTNAGKPAEKPVGNPTHGEQKKPAKNVPEKEKPVEALWEPVKPAPNFLDKLKATAKDTCLYAVLSTVLFYWQQTGRLEETTAWYALLVCVGMVFFSVGKNCRGGK